MEEKESSKQKKSESLASLDIPKGSPSVRSMRNGEGPAIGEHHEGNFNTYFGHKIAKLLQQQQNEGPSQHTSSIFEGCFVHVNGYTQPPIQEIKRLVLLHGGTFNAYQTEKTTHFICDYLPETKIRQLRSVQKRRLHYVTTKWFTDSIERGFRLLESGYLPDGLYDKQDRNLSNFIKHDTFTNKNFVEKDVDFSGDKLNTTSKKRQSLLNEIVVSSDNHDHKVNRMDSPLPIRTSSSSVGIEWENQNNIPFSFQEGARDTLHLEEGVCGETEEAVTESMTVNRRLDYDEKVEEEKEHICSHDDSGGVRPREEEVAVFQASLAPFKLDRPECLMTSKSHRSSKNCNAPLISHSSLPEASTSSMKYSTTTTTTTTSRTTTTSTTNATATASSTSKRMSSEDDPHFLEKYFHSSRLHFIGTWRSRLPQIMKRIRAQAFSADSLGVTVPLGSGAIGPVTAGMSAEDREQERLVVHIDMDCFFVSALIRDKPELWDKPVAVAHSKSGGTSEVSACNYVARAKGVHSDMFMAKALQLCPDLLVLHYDFPLYQQISEQIYAICISSAPLVQPVSVDEVYLELPRGSDAVAVVRSLRDKIFETTRCNASAGIGPNMLIARMTTKLAKPNGQHHIKSDEVSSRLGSMKLSDLPGVGYSMTEKLTEKGVTFCSDLWRVNKRTVQEWLGAAHGDWLWEAARGLDDRPLQPPAQRKSIGAEVNWGLRFQKRSAAEEFLVKLAGEVSSRLGEAGLKGKTVTVKVKRRSAGEGEPIKFLGCGRCDNISKSNSFQTPSLYSAESIAKAALPIFRSLVAPDYDESSGFGTVGTKTSSTTSSSQFPVTDLRGMGIQISRLEDLDHSYQELEPAASISKSISTSSTSKPLSSYFKKKDLVDTGGLGSSSHQMETVDSFESFQEDGDDDDCDYETRLQDDSSLGYWASSIPTNLIDPSKEKEERRIDLFEPNVVVERGLRDETSTGVDVKEREREEVEIDQMKLDFELDDRMMEELMNRQNDLTNEFSNEIRSENIYFHESNLISLKPSIEDANRTLKDNKSVGQEPFHSKKRKRGGTSTTTTSSAGFDITLTQLDFLSALPPEIRKEQMHLLKYQHISTSPSKTAKSSPNKASFLPYDATRTMTSLSKPNKSTVKPNKKTKKADVKASKPSTRGPPRVPPIAREVDEIRPAEVVADIVEEKIIAPGTDGTSKSLGLLEVSGGQRGVWGRENILSIRDSLRLFRKSIGDHPSLEHLNLLREYGAWLVHSMQSDLAVSFLHACTTTLLLDTDTDSSGAKTNRALSWRDVVERTREAIQSHSCLVNGAPIRFL